ncbi:uncharacterized protein LOC118436460 [Folsomia candida]|uniref:uncharacterized protein LOC118436460 n=1 Tax=Folsomia candida TaxID=158441 RepID=UPI001604FBC7|nr:uncharacterized protein LOC118436460 [Folsomia candida]
MPYVTRIDPVDRLLAFAQYDIVNEDGCQMYIAVENTTSKALKWTRDARMFNVTMYDHKCNKVLQITRSCSPGFCCAQYCCGFCIFGFKGCGNYVTVTLCETGRFLGRIEQEFSWDETVLKIFDEIGKNVMIVTGKLVDGVFDVAFPEDEDEPIAMIETLMNAQEVSAFYNIQISGYEDPYGLTLLSMTLSPKYKALIISAIILMDYMFLKPTTDFPHWTQFIPYDFKPEDQTRDKTFSDGSKEIIVTSMKPRHNWINILRQERRCGCCRWFFGFICLCCPLGFVRNGLRCVLLILVISVIVAGLVFVVVFFTRK